VLESSEADQAAGEVEQRFVCCGAAVVADVEAAVLVEPGEGALDDPAPAAETGAMHGLTACDQWGDTARTQLAAVELLVVAAVRDQATRPPFRRAGAAVHRWDRLE
jgi:hypothetical protein